MYVLRKGESVVIKPERLPGARIIARPATLAEFTDLDRLWQGLSSSEEEYLAVLERHILGIDGLAAETDQGIVEVKTAADVVTFCQAWVLQLLVFEIGRASSLEGQQQLDSLPPPSGGATDPGGTAPRVDPP